MFWSWSFPEHPEFAIWETWVVKRGDANGQFGEGDGTESNAEFRDTSSGQPT